MFPNNRTRRNESFTFSDQPRGLRKWRGGIIHRSNTEELSLWINPGQSLQRSRIAEDRTGTYPEQAMTQSTNMIGARSGREGEL